MASAASDESFEAPDEPFRGADDLFEAADGPFKAQGEPSEAADEPFEALDDSSEAADEPSEAADDASEALDEASEAPNAAPGNENEISDQSNSAAARWNDYERAVLAHAATTECQRLGILVSPAPNTSEVNGESMPEILKDPVYGRWMWGAIAIAFLWNLLPSLLTRRLLVRCASTDILQIIKGWVMLALAVLAVWIVCARGWRSGLVCFLLWMASAFIGHLGMKLLQPFAIGRLTGSDLEEIAAARRRERPLDD